MTVSNWTPEQREQIVRLCLTADPTTSHVELSKAISAMGLTCSKETVRKIRVGIAWANLLPELPRGTHNFGRRCWNCRFVSDDNSHCTLGIPEATGTDGKMASQFAVRCSSYMDKDDAIS